MDNIKSTQQHIFPLHIRPYSIRIRCSFSFKSHSGLIWSESVSICAHSFSTIKCNISNSVQIVDMGIDVTNIYRHIKQMSILLYNKMKLLYGKQKQMRCTNTALFDCIGMNSEHNAHITQHLSIAFWCYLFTSSSVLFLCLYHRTFTLIKHKLCMHRL